MAVETGTPVQEVEQWPIALVMEWAAYYKILDKRDREELELEMQNELDENTKTKNLFDILRTIGNKSHVNK